MSAIQKELKQVRPFTARSVEGVVALLRTTDLLRRVLSGVVESRHLTLQQFNVLRILRGSGPDGMPTLEIGERMIEQSPGITRLMDRLESKALVKRARCPRDRRQVLCRITPSGLAVLAALEAPMEQAARSFLGCLGETRTRELIHLLDAVRAAQGAPEDLPPSIRTGKPVPHLKQGEKR